MRYSVLDQSPIPSGQTGGQALRNSLELARLADQAGYHRYWMAEHHATPALASAIPEILLSLVGEQTSHIRIGTGGVMLPHYSPLRVAECFSMLAGLHPGRLDLGLGRAPGSDQLTAFALQQDRRQRAPNNFPEQLTELLGYFDGDLPQDHPFQHLAQTLPCREEIPDIWVLGSSPDSAKLAGIMGLPYCIADFIAGEVPQLAESYRQHFQPSKRARHPQVMVACWLIAAESFEQAEWLAAPSRMMMSHLAMGQQIGVPTSDVAMQWLAANPQRHPIGRRPILGSPADCADALSRKADRYGAEEMMLVNIMHDHQARLNSYRLMADQLDIRAPEQLQTANI